MKANAKQFFEALKGNDPKASFNGRLSRKSNGNLALRRKIRLKRHKNNEEAPCGHAIRYIVRGKCIACGELLPPMPAMEKVKP